MISRPVRSRPQSDRLVADRLGLEFQFVCAGGHRIDHNAAPRPLLEAAGRSRGQKPFQNGQGDRAFRCR